LTWHYEDHPTAVAQTPEIVVVRPHAVKFRRGETAATSPFTIDVSACGTVSWTRRQRQLSYFDISRHFRPHRLCHGNRFGKKISSCPKIRANPYGLNGRSMAIRTTRPALVVRGKMLRKVFANSPNGM
jgi:hypothetical protein